MKLSRYALAALLLASHCHSQTFQSFLNRVSSAPESLRTAIVDSFMASVSSFPMIEQDSLVHFMLRGQATSVTVPCDANAWDPNGFPMTRIAGTDLWYFTLVVESDARLDYKFVLNGSTWILDPRNPNTITGGFGPNSELKMPRYPEAPEVRYYPDIPHGALRDTAITSTRLGNTRTIRVYTPPGYESSADSFGVVLFHDGLEYISLAQANNVIDYLTSRNRIQPIIAVFVPPVNRGPEYGGNQQVPFMAFINEELMPYIERRYRTKRSPSFRAVVGASLGGNISLLLGYQYHNIFGNVAAQSSAIPSGLSNAYENSPRLDLKLYLDLGTYDIPALIPQVRQFIPILQVKGYSYVYREYHEGHSWGNWRAHIDDALEFFFGAQPTKVREESKPEGFRLEQNYPNPVNPVTRIEYSLGQRSRVKIEVFDLLGRRVSTLVDDDQSPGPHRTEWKPEVASGAYLYRLEALSLDGRSRYSDSRKMLVLR